MNKELTPLQALENIEKEIADYEGFDENTYYQMDRTRFVIIENALKSLETLRKALTISYRETPMSVTRDENGVTINSEVSLDITRNAIDEEFRKSLRQWILENACPKEVRALEIIKERRLDVNELIDLVHHKDKYLLLDEYNKYVFANPITKEELDLFSEVL